MPVIRVEMSAGRTQDQKCALVRQLTDTFVNAVGGTQNSVQVVIYEVDKGDWGLGGQMCSDKAPQ